MFHEWCFTCVLLVFPLFAASDPLLLKSELGSDGLAEPEALRMFDDFLLTFGRKYGSPEEYKRRFAIFRNNLENIDRLNHEEQGTAKYGITRFADLTYSEFVRNFTGGQISRENWEWHEKAMEKEPDTEIEYVDEELDDIRTAADGKVFLPKKYDYRKKKAVTPVKDQGSCGSCWAFSVMANIEGVYAKKKKELLNLSEQELVDCDKVNYACNGGWMTDAVKELVRLGGVATAKDYPYAGYQQPCKFKKKMAAVKVAGVKTIPPNENKIAKALIKHGPLSIAVQASMNFQFYQSGIFDPSTGQCSDKKESVNHAVTIVAYGEEKKKKMEGDTVNKEKVPYWVIKNSWNTRWGESGYMRLIRGKNACAMNTYVSTAFL